MNKNKSIDFIRNKKLTCDWTDKKNMLSHFSMAKFYVRHRMVLEKLHEKTSFKQSKWLERTINFNTQKRILATNDFGKDFYKIFNNAFYEKTMENVLKRIKVEITFKTLEH